MTLFSTSLTLAITSMKQAMNTVKPQDGMLARISTLRVVKHDDFMSGLVMIFVNLIARRWRCHQGRSVVRAMLTLDNSALMDLNLTRGDLLYVLQTRSPIDPTARLRLLSIERRNINKNDHQRRATYIRDLVPSPFHGSVHDQNASRKAAV